MFDESLEKANEIFSLRIFFYFRSRINFFLNIVINKIYNEKNENFLRDKIFLSVFIINIIKEDTIKLYWNTNIPF